MPIVQRVVGGVSYFDALDRGVMLTYQYHAIRGPSSARQPPGPGKSTPTRPTPGNPARDAHRTAFPAFARPTDRPRTAPRAPAPAPSLLPVPTGPGIAGTMRDTRKPRTEARGWSFSPSVRPFPPRTSLSDGAIIAPYWMWYHILPKGRNLSTPGRSFVPSCGCSGPVSNGFPNLETRSEPRPGLPGSPGLTPRSPGWR